MGPGDEASRKWHQRVNILGGARLLSRYIVEIRVWVRTVRYVRVSNVDVILRCCGIDENDRRRLDKLLISQIWPDVLLSMESFFKGEYKEK